MNGRGDGLGQVALKLGKSFFKPVQSAGIHASGVRRDRGSNGGAVAGAWSHCEEARKVGVVDLRYLEEDPDTFGSAPNGATSVAESGGKDLGEENRWS